jgi:hypothetical protein
MKKTVLLHPDICFKELTEYLRDLGGNKIISPELAVIAKNLQMNR